MIRPVVLFALLLATPAAAQGPCLSGDAVRDGMLVRLRHQHPNGSWFRAFVLRLPKPVCVLDEMAVGMRSNARSGFFPKTRPSSPTMSGARCASPGKGPIVGDTAWHVRDLTIMRAKVVNRRPK